MPPSSRVVTAGTDSWRLDLEAGDTLSRWMWPSGPRTRSGGTISKMFVYRCLCVIFGNLRITLVWAIRWSLGGCGCQTMCPVAALGCCQVFPLVVPHLSPCLGCRQAAGAATVPTLVFIKQFLCLAPPSGGEAGVCCQNLI